MEEEVIEETCESGMQQRKTELQAQIQEYLEKLDFLTNKFHLLVMELLSLD